MKNSSDAISRQSQASKKATIELDEYKKTLNDIENWTNIAEKRGVVSQDDINNMRTQIENAKAASSNVKNFKSEVDKLSASQKALAVSTKESTAEQTRQNEILSGLTHTNNLYSQISGIFDKNPRIKENIALFNEFTRIQNESLKLAPSDTKGWKKLSQDLSHAKQQMHELGLASETLGQRLVRLFKDHFNTALTMAALHALQNAMIGIYQNVLDIDRAMTDLKKVSSGTQAQYEQFLSGAADRAMMLGTTMSDVVDASAEFSRLGFNLEESAILGDAAAMYKNVSEYEDIAEASQSIVSTMQAFGVEAEDVMSIVDRLNNVGNNFSISSQGLGEGLRRSAAALASAGNDIDESIAMITAGNTVIQDPDAVGTALKTLSMRLRGTKTDLENAGEETEGMADTVSQLREKLLALTNQKVDIQLDPDTYKSSYRILSEMSAVWSDMTDMQRAAALELMGGKRQGNILASIIEQFDVAENALESSRNSIGSAAEENAKYLDSIEGKMSQFSAQFQGLSTEILNSELVKGVFDAGSGILGFLTAVIDKFGSLKGFVAPVAGMLLTLTNKGFLRTKANDEKLSGRELQIASPIKIYKDYVSQSKSIKADTQAITDYINALKGIDADNIRKAFSGLTDDKIPQTMKGSSDSCKKFAKELKVTAASYDEADKMARIYSEAQRSNIFTTNMFANATRTAAAAVKGFMVTIGHMLAIAAVTFVLQKIAEGIDSIHMSAKEAAEATQKAVSDFENQRSAIDSNIKTAESLRNRYDELSRGVNDLGENVALSADEYAEYKSIVEQIVGMTPAVVQGYNDESDAIVNKNGLIQQSIDLLRQERMEKAKNTLYSREGNDGKKTNLEAAIIDFNANYKEQRR